MSTAPLCIAIIIALTGVAPSEVSPPDCKNPTGQSIFCPLCGFTFRLASEIEFGVWICPSEDRACYPVEEFNEAALARVLSQTELCLEVRTCDPKYPWLPVHPMNNPCVKGPVFSQTYITTYRWAGDCE